jgi:hypothetical protein
MSQDIRSLNQLNNNNFFMTLIKYFSEYHQRVLFNKVPFYNSHKKAFRVLFTPNKTFRDIPEQFNDMFIFSFRIFNTLSQVFQGSPKKSLLEVPLRESI